MRRMHSTIFKRAIKYCKLVVIVACLFSTQQVFSADSEKLLRMQNTIDELTIRLSSVLEENKRLSLALKQALEASHRGEKVKVGCDWKSVEEEMAFSDVKEYVLKRFLKTHGAKCTKDQLLLIQKNKSKWAGGISTRDTDPMLNFSVKKLVSRY